jgi:hypothetical protein
MATIFDFLSVACFAGAVIGFFQFTDRAIKTLLQLMAPSIAFAVSNQLGNIGYTALALLLVLAGVVYTGLVLRQSPN